MKKLFFITATVLFSLNVFSQGLNLRPKINTNDLIGYWKSNQDSCGLFFWKDYKSNLHMGKTISGDISDLELVKFKINKNNIFSKTISEDNNCLVKSTYKLINANTIQCSSINNNTKVITIYTKTK
jgi:hypothetical protein